MEFGARPVSPVQVLSSVPSAELPTTATYPAALSCMATAHAQRPELCGQTEGWVPGPVTSSVNRALGLDSGPMGSWSQVGTCCALCPGRASRLGKMASLGWIKHSTEMTEQQGARLRGAHTSHQAQEAPPAQRPSTGRATSNGRDLGASPRSGDSTTLTTLEIQRPGWGLVSPRIERHPGKLEQRGWVRQLDGVWLSPQTLSSTLCLWLEGARWT